MKTEYKIGDTLYIKGANYTLLDAELLGMGNFGRMLLMDENNQLFIWQPGNEKFPYVLLDPYRHGNYIDVYYDGTFIYKSKDGESFVDKYPTDFESFISEQIGNNRLSDNTDVLLDFSLKFNESQLNELDNTNEESDVGKGTNSYSSNGDNMHKADGPTTGENDTPTTSGSVPNSLTSCTFASDYDDLMRISKMLNDYADSIKGYVTDIYSIVDGDLADAWQGETYQMFSDMCHGYQNTLNDLNVLLYAFSSMYKDVASQTEVLHDNIKQIVDYRFGGDVDGN